jgi:hypothetical protein
MRKCDDHAWLEMRKCDDHAWLPSCHLGSLTFQRELCSDSYHLHTLRFWCKLNTPETYLQFHDVC